MAARAGRILALAAAGALLLGGCSEVRDRITATSDDEVLRAVSLTSDDAAEGALFEDYPGGDQVQGEVSLDLCYGEFPSEDLRVGRLQVGIGDEPATTWVSSEAILYSTPEQAEQAMRELALAREQCPQDLVEPDQPDRLPLVWEFRDAPDADWPSTEGVARQAYEFTVSDAEGQSWTSTATYLQRGRMVLALYCSPPDGPATVIHNSPTQARFTEVMSNRLKSIPAASLESGGSDSDGGGLDA